MAESVCVCARAALCLSMVQNQPGGELLLGASLCCSHFQEKPTGNGKCFASLEASADFSQSADASLRRGQSVAAAAAAVAATI